MPSIVVRALHSPLNQVAAMSDVTPRDNSTVLFPKPLERSRAPLWLAIGALALSAAMVVGLLMTDSDPDAPEPAPEFAAVLPPRPAAAPAARSTRLVDAGVRAFETASYDTAAGTLRRALAGQGADSLTGGQRTRALTYLAASHFLRGRRAESDSAFRQLLRVNPRARPDDLIFPAAVVARYEHVRAALHGVAKIRTTPQGVALVVVSFNPHRAGVGVRAPNGRPLMTLFDGVVRDSVVVSWDGTGPNGAPAPPGAYDLVLIAFGKDGGIANVVSFPVVMQPPDSGGRARPRSVASPTPTAPGGPAPLGGHGGQLMP